MKKIGFILLFTIVLSTCQFNQEKSSFESLNKVPVAVEEVIDSSNRLQSVTKKPGNYYIVFQSEKEVIATMAEEDKIVHIEFEEQKNNADDSYHYYYLTVVGEDMTIKVSLNGEEIWFDQMYLGRIEGNNVHR